MNKLNVSLQHSIATLAAHGWSARKIARELGVDRETVGRYLRPPEDSKPAIPPTGSPEDPDSKPAIVPAGSKAGRTSQCRPWRAVIEQRLWAGLSAQRIYQDLVAEHGFTGGYDAVKRFVRRLAQRVEPPFRRMECEPGQEVQVDFGQGGVGPGERKAPTAAFVSVCAESFTQQGDALTQSASREALWVQAPPALFGVWKMPFVTLAA